MGCSSSNTIDNKQQKFKKDNQEYRFHTLKEKYLKFKDIGDDLNYENVKNAYKINKKTLSNLNISEEDFIEATMNEIAGKELKRRTFKNLNVNEYLEVIVELGIPQEEFENFKLSLQPIWKEQVKSLILKAGSEELLIPYFYNNLKYNPQFQDISLINFITTENIEDLLDESEESILRRKKFYEDISDVIKECRNLESFVFGIEARAKDESERYVIKGDFFSSIFQAIKQNTQIKSFGLINVGNVTFELGVESQKLLADCFKNQNLLLTACTLINLDSTYFNMILHNIQLNKGLKGFVLITENLDQSMLNSFWNSIGKSKFLKGCIIGAVESITEKMKEELQAVRAKNKNLITIAVCEKETIHNI
jgi:hypothetical protein